MVLVEREAELGDERSGRGKQKNESESSQSQKKQCTLSNTTVPATRLCSLLSNYAIEDMMPLSMVELPAFRKLIGVICSTPVPNRKSFTVYVDKPYDQMVQRVKVALEKVDHVSTTVDVWTAHNRRFLGLTVH